MTTQRYVSTYNLSQTPQIVNKTTKNHPEPSYNSQITIKTRIVVNDLVLNILSLGNIFGDNKLIIRVHYHGNPMEQINTKIVSHIEILWRIKIAFLIFIRYSFTNTITGCSSVNGL